MSTYSQEEYNRNKASYLERQRRYKQTHRELVAEKQREYRKRTPEKLLEYRRRKYKEQSEWVISHKKGKSCLWCGFTDWRALQFHHRDPLQKSFSIQKKIGVISLERIKAEIEKCDLICANCHQIHHSPNQVAPL